MHSVVVEVEGNTIEPVQVRAERQEPAVAILDDKLSGSPTTQPNRLHPASSEQRPNFGIDHIGVLKSNHLVTKYPLAVVEQRRW
jgi:hypothetical protein